MQAPDKPVLMKEAKVEFIDDGPGKPVGINRFIGRRPVLAFGNSDGDQQMLEWTAAGDGLRFMGLVHHTDAVREYAYDRNSPIGRLDKAWDEAVRRKWLGRRHEERLEGDLSFRAEVMPSRYRRRPPCRAGPPATPISLRQEEGRMSDRTTANEAIHAAETCCSEAAHCPSSASWRIAAAGQAQQQPAPPAPGARKPNILVIFGDDIGIANISAYSNGLMGYETPNIDRIAREGIKFQHYYGEQSCTAGRAAFLTGQHGIRTGLTKVGFPGAPMGMSQLDPSIGGLLKNLGYATGQFGKNHVGDRNETLPTVNGFDEFFGNLYHLNAEEEPELPDYPKDPAYRAKFGPRGVLRCKATDRDDPTVDPRFGKVGKQTIEDTGALTKKRMETIDDETSAAAIDFMKRQQTAGKPFFCWFNSTRMHLRTHVRAEHRGRYKHGDSEYIDGMMEHDDTIGSLLKALDDMGIANNTIVVYTSDNGPHMNTWPDGAMTWFRSEKNTNWEGAFRVPCLVRWPGVIKPGTVTNELMSHNDWVPTLCAIAGEPDIVGKAARRATRPTASTTRCTSTATTSPRSCAA